MWCCGCGASVGAMSTTSHIALHLGLMLFSCSTAIVCGEVSAPHADALSVLLDHTLWLHVGACKVALHQMKRRCWMQVSHKTVVLVCVLCQQLVCVLCICLAIVPAEGGWFANTATWAGQPGCRLPTTHQSESTLAIVLVWGQLDECAC